MSTLGLPGADLEEAIRVAVAGGCAGLELRAHPDTGIHAGLDDAARASVRSMIDEAGLAPLAVAGYVRIAAPGPNGPVVSELMDDVRLAADLGAPYVRVFPGGPDGTAAVRRLRTVAGDAEAVGVKILVETHDSHPSGAAVARLLNAVDRPEATGAIWDLLHPWRHGEDPADTLNALGDHLTYVQIKDTVSADDPRPVSIGKGSMPLTYAGELLWAAGFTGWASLEWERTWYPDIPPVEEVLSGAHAWAQEYLYGS